MYEGRRDDALRDACVGFDVVLKMDVWEDLGLRLITEIALLDGSAVNRGVVEPALVPLGKVDVLPDGRIVWLLEASAGAGGMLDWTGETDRTPATLREKLVRARALAQIRATATTLDVVADATLRAGRHLMAGEAERALATLRSAWAQRRDSRLITGAQQALAQSPGSFAQERTTALALRAEIEQFTRARRWRLARQAYESMLADLALVAAATPIGGWDQIEEAIRAGLAQDADAEEARLEAETAMRQGQPRVAVDVLSRFAISDLPVATALPLIRVREAAMERLFAQGQGSDAALRTVRAQRAALEQALAAEGDDDQGRRGA
jgi:hypothetical protein